MKDSTNGSNGTRSWSRLWLGRFHKSNAAVSPFRSSLVILSVLFMAVGVGFVLWHLHRQQLALYHSMALQGTSIQVESIRQFRRLYSAEVASRAKSYGIDIAHDYENKDHALPLPATLTMKLGEALNRESGGNVR